MEAHRAQATATRESACFSTNAVTETRKLAAILVADVVGYSRLAGADEDRILARLRTLRSDLIDPTSPSITGASSSAPETAQLSSSAASSTRCDAPSKSRAV
jgi:hypothetical protein